MDCQDLRSLGKKRIFVRFTVEPQNKWREGRQSSRSVEGSPCLLAPHERQCSACCRSFREQVLTTPNLGLYLFLRNIGKLWRWMFSFLFFLNASWIPPFPADCVPLKISHWPQSKCGFPSPWSSLKNFINSILNWITTSLNKCFEFWATLE